MSNITTYHNPSCSISRNTLEMIHDSDTEPTAILYLETPPLHDGPVKLVADMSVSVWALLRENVEPYEGLGPTGNRFIDDRLIDSTLQYLILISRPIVTAPLGTELCRPSEAVPDIFPNTQKAAFTKGGGERVVDSAGKRLK